MGVYTTKISDADFTEVVLIAVRRTFSYQHICKNTVFKGEHSTVPFKIYYYTFIHSLLLHSRGFKNRYVYLDGIFVIYQFLCVI